MSARGGPRPRGPAARAGRCAPRSPDGGALSGGVGGGRGTRVWPLDLHLAHDSVLGRDGYARVPLDAPRDDDCRSAVPTASASRPRPAAAALADRRGEGSPAAPSGGQPTAGPSCAVRPAPHVTSPPRGDDGVRAPAGSSAVCLPSGPAAAAPWARTPRRSGCRGVPPALPRPGPCPVGCSGGASAGVCALPGAGQGVGAGRGAFASSRPRMRPSGRAAVRPSGAWAAVGSLRRVFGSRPAFPGFPRSVRPLSCRAPLR